MRRVFGLAFLAAAILAPSARAEDPRGFDGVWSTEVTCENASGALGYVFKFPSVVTGGRLHGEKGHKGEPGYFQINGVIQPNGEGLLDADGLVGASAEAVGQRPKGAAYGYHVRARFAATSASGERVEGRPCHLTFAKQ